MNAREQARHCKDSFRGGERTRVPVSINAIIGGLLALVVVLWLAGF